MFDEEAEGVCVLYDVCGVWFFLCGVSDECCVCGVWCVVCGV